jgi:thiamine-phosphate pyrophosphorylase
MRQSQPQAAIRRKLLAAARLATPALARNSRPLPAAWFVTDPTRTPHPAAIAARLPRGWGVIYRHHGAADRATIATHLARTCRLHGLILLVSADPQLASRIGADGVHWPEKRLRGVRARSPHFIETASAHSRAAIARAARLGIDAVLVSTVFASRSASAGQPMGALRFRQLARNAPLPVYALGGVTADSAASAMPYAAGWAGVDAVMSGWGEP